MVKCPGFRITILNVFYFQVFWCFFLTKTEKDMITDNNFDNFNIHKIKNMHLFTCKYQKSFCNLQVLGVFL